MNKIQRLTIKKSFSLPAEFIFIALDKTLIGNNWVCHENQLDGAGVKLPMVRSQALLGDVLRLC